MDNTISLENEKPHNLQFQFSEFSKLIGINHNFIHEGKQTQAYDFRLKHFNTRRHSRKQQLQRGREK